MQSKDLLGQSFWQFCLAYYPALKRQLLTLQDIHQLNVNLLLFAGYVDEHNSTISISQWRILVEAIAASEQTLLPLRQQRRAVKGINDEQYQALLATELKLEKQQQTVILETALSWLPLSSGSDNIAQYGRAVYASAHTLVKLVALQNAFQQNSKKKD